MEKIIYDIEVYPNLFLFVAKELNKDKWDIFCFHNEVDEKLLQKFNKFVTRKAIWIGFNNKHYDNEVSEAFVVTQNLFSTYRKSVDIIENKAWGDKQNKYNYYSSNNLFKPYLVDLLLFWSQGLRLSKKISLKSLAVQLNHDNIQELPIDPHSIITDDDLKVLMKYCKNDVIVTEKVANYLTDSNSPKTGSIKLRDTIRKRAGFSKSFHWDVPKIASELLFLEYTKKVKIDNPYEFKNSERTKQTLLIKDVLKSFNPDFKTDQFKNFYKVLLNSDNSFSYKTNFIVNNTAISVSFGIGGVHTVNKNETYKSKDDMIIVSSDVASLYPTNIINHQTIKQKEVLEVYEKIKQERLQAKKSKNKLVDMFLKLVLNSVSGLLDSPYSWLFYQEGALKLRLIGQLQLAKFAESLALAGFKVISINTDGAETILNVNDYDKYLNIVADIEKQFNIVFEHARYDFINYVSVNDYIAKEESGKVKQKGLFVTKPDFGDSVDFLIVPKALEAYYINGIEPDEFIVNHINSSDLAIYDYCMSPKVDKTYTVIYMDKKIQRLNRVYPSSNNNDGYLYKKRGSEIAHLLKSSPVKIFNKYERKQNYEINYAFFIKKVKEIIFNLTPQPTLFD
jgi:hypothetical protein